MKSASTFLLLLLSASTAFATDVKAEIKVSGMTCGACSVSVKSALTRVKGVKSADVSYEKGLATVVYDDQQTNEQQLREAINKTGFKAESNPEKK
jgi:mercuric ion binding protein